MSDYSNRVEPPPIEPQEVTALVRKLTDREMGESDSVMRDAVAEADSWLGLDESTKSAQSPDISRVADHEQRLTRVVDSQQSLETQINIHSVERHAAPLAEVGDADKRIAGFLGASALTVIAFVLGAGILLLVVWALTTSVFRR